MSSSNLAVRMENTATDLLSDPPRLTSGDTVTTERLGPNFRRRLSLTNRKAFAREHGLRYFRIR